MRRINFLISIIFWFILPCEAEVLYDIYKTGKIKFIEEKIITNDNFPEEANFILPIDLAIDKEGSLYVCDLRANNI